MRSQESSLPEKQISAGMFSMNSSMSSNSKKAPFDFQIQPDNYPSIPVSIDKKFEKMNFHRKYLDRISDRLHISPKR